MDYHVLIWILMSIHVVSNMIYIFTCNIIYYLSNLIYWGYFVVVHIFHVRYYYFLDNFFLYSNGNWMKNNPIPSGYPNWNSFMALHLKSQEDCKTILTELEEKLKSGEGVTDEERKVALFYMKAMDEDAIEKEGVDPMKPLLELCEEAANCKDDKVAFAKCLGQMALKYSVTPFFSIGAG